MGRLAKEIAQTKQDMKDVNEYPLDDSDTAVRIITFLMGHQKKNA